MFTKVFLGKRPIYCSHFQITSVSFLPDSEKISQTTIEAWTDTGRVFWMISKCLNQVKKETWLCKWQSDATDDMQDRSSTQNFVWSGHHKTENHWKSNTMCCLPKNEALTDTLKTKTSAKQTEKETEHKCLWQNYYYKERWNNTNAIKWKMAALIRQANNWNQMARWKWCWKKYQGERGMEKKSITPTRSKTVHCNCPWQRAMCHLYTQYKPHNNASNQWAIDTHEVST